MCPLMLIKVKGVNMTFYELHQILDNEDRKLSKAELEEVIYQLRQDVYKEFCSIVSDNPVSPILIRKARFYDGEQNAFQIVLDLLEHLDIKE